MELLYVKKYDFLKIISKAFKYSSARITILALLIFGLNSCSLIYTVSYLKHYHHNVTNPIKAHRKLKITNEKKFSLNSIQNRRKFDVKYYELDLTLNPTLKKISGSVTIHSLSKMAIDTIQLDLSRKLDVASINLNGNKVKYERKYDGIIILPNESIPENNEFWVTIAYEGMPQEAKRPPWQGGMVWKKDKQGRNWISIACESEGAKLWWPNKEDLSDEPDSVKVSITIPEKLMVVSNGILIDSSAYSRNNIKYTWKTSYPINNYNVTFCVGNFKAFPDTFYNPINGDTLHITYYLLPEHESFSELTHLAQVKDQIAFFEKKFGSYPWPKDGFKLIETPFAGMEHQTAISIGSKLENGPFNCNQLILHETAHEWWGNSVTASDFSDIWLQEGFATFAEALYIENVNGRQAYLNYLYWKRVRINNKKPLIGPKNLHYFDPTDEDVYNKGAWILHSLRTIINEDSLFFKIVKEFRIRNHQKQITSESFINIVNELSGKNYSWFFDHYLYNRKVPILKYYTRGGKLFYKWLNTKSNFNELPIEFVFGTTSKQVFPSTEWQFTSIPNKFRGRIKFSDNIIYFGYKHKCALKNWIRRLQVNFKHLGSTQETTYTFKL